MGICEYLWVEFKTEKTIEESKAEILRKTIGVAVNGEKDFTEGYFADGKNLFIADFIRRLGFDVGFNERTKVPSFVVSVSEDNIIIAGKDVTVHKILKSNENYIRLRDLKDILNIDYDEINKKVIVDVK